MNKNTGFELYGCKIEINRKDDGSRFYTVTHRSEKIQDAETPADAMTIAKQIMKGQFTAKAKQPKSDTKAEES